MLVADSSADLTYDYVYSLEGLGKVFGELGAIHLTDVLVNINYYIVPRSQCRPTSFQVADDASSNAIPNDGFLRYFLAYNCNHARLGVARKVGLNRKQAARPTVGAPFVYTVYF
jgi:hypothetical protein